MTDEATFLASLAERPDDDDLRLVYADWLEGNGEPRRADVLRGMVALRAIPYDDAAIVPAARALIELSSGIRAEWLEYVSHPRIDGTAWGLRDGNKREYLLAFETDGKLCYRRTDDTTAGTWGQVGAAVWFMINDYSFHEVVFVGDRMKGDAANPMRMTWGVHAIRLPAGVIYEDRFPDLPEDLADTPYVENETLPKGAPGLRERVTGRGTVWWVKEPASLKKRRARKRAREFSAEAKQTVVRAARTPAKKPVKKAKPKKTPVRAPKPPRRAGRRPSD